MIQIVIISHVDIANSFASCVEYILANPVNNLHIIAVKKTEDMESVLAKATNSIQELSNKNQVLLLTDIMGATPSNIAKQLIKKGKVELITGLNLPMLIRAISYANVDLATCVEKTLEGGHTGIIHVGEQ